jgi:hypothetical protein
MPQQDRTGRDVGVLVGQRAAHGGDGRQDRQIVQSPTPAIALRAAALLCVGGKLRRGQGATVLK